MPRVTNKVQELDQLTGRKRRGRAASEIDALQRSSCEQVLRTIETNFAREGGAECINPFSLAYLKIEGAKMTALSAEWDMDVDADISQRGHNQIEKGSDFEKSLARTTSISSVGEAPLFRM